MTLSSIAFGIAAGLPRLIANDVVASRVADEAASAKYRPTMAELVARYGPPRGGAGATFYVRKTGSDSNSGSSSGTSPQRSGADMGTTNGSTQVTSASGAFSSGDVGKTINIAGVIYRIATFTNSTTIQLDRTYAASTGSNRTWAIGGAVQTIGKILQTAAQIMQNGDTLVVGAGTYRETISVAHTAFTATASILGDVDGSLVGDPGEIILTAFTTNDTSAPSASSTLSLNGKPYIAVSKMTIIGGTNANGTAVALTTVGSHDCSLTDCTLIGATVSAAALSATTSAGVALNLTVDRCRILNFGGSGIQCTIARHTADYDTGIVIRNSLVFSNGGGSTAAARFTSTGAGTGFGGNAKISYCTLYGLTGVSANDASLSTSQPITVIGCVIGASVALSANTSGQIVESYNALFAPTPRTNVAVGTGSSVTLAPLFQVGQERVVGGRNRPFLEPASGSPVLNFSLAASPPTVDLNNNPRPSGGAGPNPAAGALGRGNTFGKETGTVRTGSAATSIVGPGYQDFQLPVDALPITVSIYGRYDGTYTGTLPSLSVLNGAENGVADATATMVGGANAWEQISLPISPTSAGIVTIRLRSQDTSGAGKAIFDDFAVN
jgi:hypothetical protein